jgi:hypothetical protein
MVPELRSHHAEVDELHGGAATLDQEHVRELQVPVHDAARVDGGHRLGRAPDHLDGVAGAEGRAPLPLRQVLAVEPLHREEQAPVRVFAVGHVVDDVGMAQIGNDAYLAPEPCALTLAGGAPQDLERHREPALGVDGAKDVAARPAADACFDHESLGLLARILEHGRPCSITKAGAAEGARRSAVQREKYQKASHLDSARHAASNPRRDAS